MEYLQYNTTQKIMFLNFIMNNNNNSNIKYQYQFQFNSIECHKQYLITIVILINNMTPME